MGNFLAPTPRWQGRDKTGQPAINGYVYTWQNQTRIPQVTYSDVAGTNANPNPVPLDGKGEANIYWIDSNLYSISLYQSDNSLVETQDNYPVSSGNGGGSITITTLQDNIVRNAQFDFWSNTANFGAYTSTTNVSSDFIADDWALYRTGTSPTINLSQQALPLGQTDITEGTPTYYFHYECTAVNSSGETIKNLVQSYKSVQTMENSEVAFAFWARSSSLSSVSVSATQYFGTGGSPSANVVTTLIASTALTASWTHYTGTATLPSVSAKTIGSNNDDELLLQINLPLNAVADVDIANVQFQQRSTPSAFPYFSIDEQLKRLNTFSFSVYQTGDVKPSMRPTADPGWLQLTDDGTTFNTIGSVGSGATVASWIAKGLFFVLWNAWNTTYLPIYTSLGVATTRGANAEADWNANKRMALPLTGGRVIGNCSTKSNIPGYYAGAETVSLNGDQNGLHTHTFSGWDGTYSGTGRGDGGDTLPSPPVTLTTASSGTGAAHNNIQPTVYMFFYIKL